MGRTKFTPEQLEAHSKQNAGKSKTHKWGYRNSRRLTKKARDEWKRMNGEEE